MVRLRFLFTLTLLVTADTVKAEIKPHIREIIKEFSYKKGLNPDLVSAIILVESRGRQYVIGRDGEIGLMQLHPKYFIDASFNYIKNIDVGTTYLVSIKNKKGKKDGKKCWVTYYNYGLYSKIKRPCLTSYYRKVMNEFKKSTAIKSSR